MPDETMPQVTAPVDGAKEDKHPFHSSRVDPRFEPSRVPHTRAAQELVAEVIKQVESYEKRMGTRVRARRSKDQITFEQMITAVISDLSYRYSLNPDQKVSISLSKGKIGNKSRYSPQFIGKTLPTLLGHLATQELAYLEEDKGHYFLGRQTTIQAGSGLINLMREKRVDWRDFGKGESLELIILRKEHEGRHKGKLLEYSDTPDTLRYRQEMERINTWLAGADITFDTTQCHHEEPVDPNSRTLSRIFNNCSFTQGGRLYGGFWQPLHKEERLKGIRIEGQETVSLDYSQVCPRILYGKAGVEPTSKDLYDIQRLRGHREGVKKVMNALLHAKKPLERAPMGTRSLLPKKIKIDEIVRRIAEAHPVLKPYFGSGIGMELMFMESQILVHVLLTLIKRRIVALPVHDAVTVRKDAAEEAEQVMNDAFKEHTGIIGVVTVELE